ncbi:hypothetical protein HRbin15_01594 [bacterium HR15]|nr:hypothetical protein HRbin15_01594 [bacterium HR15]
MGEEAHFDSGWKLALTAFFKDALQLLFPQVHDLIDWEKPVVFRNTELLRIVPEAQTGKRHVDLLAEVFFIDGIPGAVFLHMEVQAQPKPLFDQRMFTYYYRLYDYYKTENIVSLAVLADADPNWRPGVYRNELAGCRLSFEFPTVKLLDLDEQILAAHPSAMALVIRAHLRALRARGNLELLAREKIALLRELRAWVYS